jgi:hypothetical protein
MLDLLSCLGVEDFLKLELMRRVLSGVTDNHRTFRREGDDPVIDGHRFLLLFHWPHSTINTDVALEFLDAVEIMTPLGDLKQVILDELFGCASVGLCVEVKCSVQ